MLASMPCLFTPEKTVIDEKKFFCFYFEWMKDKISITGNYKKMQRLAKHPLIRR
jgi:hypothetical protein